MIPFRVQIIVWVEYLMRVAAELSTSQTWRLWIIKTGAGGGSCSRREEELLTSRYGTAQFEPRLKRDKKTRIVPKVHNHSRSTLSGGTEKQLEMLTSASRVRERSCFSVQGSTFLKWTLWMREWTWQSRRTECPVEKGEGLKTKTKKDDWMTLLSVTLTADQSDSWTAPGFRLRQPPISRYKFGIWRPLWWKHVAAQCVEKKPSKCRLCYTQRLRLQIRPRNPKHQDRHQLMRLHTRQRHHI